MRYIDLLHETTTRKNLSYSSARVVDLGLDEAYTPWLINQSPSERRETIRTRITRYVQGSKLSRISRVGLINTVFGTQSILIEVVWSSRLVNAMAMGWWWWWW